MRQWSQKNSNNVENPQRLESQNNNPSSSTLQYASEMTGVSNLKKQSLLVKKYKHLLNNHRISNVFPQARTYNSLVENKLVI